MKQYSQNVATGKEVIEHFVRELKNEGIIYIPPWKPQENETDGVEEKYDLFYSISVLLRYKIIKNNLTLGPKFRTAIVLRLLMRTKRKI